MLPKVTTVTSAALRDMAIGESRTFKLPDHEPYLSRAVNNGKSIAYRLQREPECRSTAETDFDNATLTLTKKPRI